MRIPSEMTNDVLEALYEKLSDDVINLPSNFKKLRLGLLPRICQLIITGLKRDPNKKVKFYQLDSTKEDAIEGFLGEPHPLTALLMSDQVFEKDAEVDGIKAPKELKSTINKEIQVRLNESIYKEGHRLQMFAVDHSSSKYAFPSCFYETAESPELRKSDFYTRLITRFVEVAPASSQLISQDFIDLGEALYELVENTEQHSKVEFNTGKVKKSVRGVVLDYSLILKDASSESIGGRGTAITKFLDGVRVKGKPLHLLEISVFDSGQGIFESLQSRSDHGSLEVDLIQSSFAKGVTSKANSKGFGRGLFNVRSVLGRRKGFLSIRTGSYSLYRDFNLFEISESESCPLALLDETKQEESHYTPLNSAEGVAYSILVPLR
jgi:hypothetical protein